MPHVDAREGNWRENWRMLSVASTLHTTSEHGVSSITTADALTSAVSSQLNWRPPADLNGLVRFAERRNLVPAGVPSHFKRSLLLHRLLYLFKGWSPGYYLVTVYFFLVTAWLLPGYFLVIYPLIPGSYLVTARLLPGHSLVTSWLLPGYCQVTFWLLLCYCLVTSMLLPGYCLVSTWLLSDYYLVTVRLLPV